MRNLESFRRKSWRKHSSSTDNTTTRWSWKKYMDVEFLQTMNFKDPDKGFTCCPYRAGLKREGFSGYIGYGIEASIYQARLNAIDASHYGRNVKRWATVVFLWMKGYTDHFKHRAWEKWSVFRRICQSNCQSGEIVFRDYLKIIGVMQSLEPMRLLLKIWWIPERFPLELPTNFFLIWKIRICRYHSAET